jgi:hypothetical protein
MAATTSKKNVPSFLIFNKNIGGVKFDKDIIVTRKLTNEQKIPCDRGKVKNIVRCNCLKV